MEVGFILMKIHLGKKFDVLSKVKNVKSVKEASIVLGIYNAVVK